MGVLTADMKRVVEQQRLGFVATVCPDGTPNLSPKGTTASGTTIISSSPTFDRRARSQTCGTTRQHTI
jgi:predicted pyridoxine 5'-phosphate oxidase superfamily flavin-nucleotide-binding protein